MRGAALILAALCLAAGLAACGGASSSSTSTASTSAQDESSTSTSMSTTPGAKTGAGQPSPSERSAKHYATAKRAAGSAAAFVVPQGDNSIPDYGAEAPSSQRNSAAVALRAYLVARAAGDWSTACSYMGSSVRKQIEVLARASKGKVKGCAGAYAMLSARVPAAERANPLTGALASLRVKSAKAFALFYGPRRQQYMMPMLSEGGAWKVNQIEAIPYPLGAPASASP